MSKNYEKLYDSQSLYWGSKPSELVKKFAELAPQGKALDLGMGEGRDVLYLASLGYDVTGVELTESGVLKCQKLAEQKGFHVKTVCQDARDYKIAKNRYALILAINLFQFLRKEEAQSVLTKAAGGLKRGGLFLCQAFTIDDPAYKVHSQKSKQIAPGVFRCASGKIHSFLDYAELLRLGSALRPLHYREYDYYDTMHGSPHWHGVAEFVGKKM